MDPQRHHRLKPGSRPENLEKLAVAQRHGAAAVVQLPAVAGGFPRVAQRLGGETIALGTEQGERTAQIDTWFYQDHFAFVEAGVPALSVAAGNDVIGRPAGYAKQRAAEYRARDYHRTSDEVRDDWDWGSIVQDAQLGVLLGLRIANGSEWPTWQGDAEFADRRPRPSPE